MFYFRFKVSIWLENSLGIFGFFILQFIILTHLVWVGACVLVLAIGLFFFSFAIAISKSINEILFSITQNATDKINQNVIWQQFVEFFEFHSKVNQFLNEFSGVFQQYFTIVFMWSLVTNCGALLMIQIQLVGVVQQSN